MKHIFFLLAIVAIALTANAQVADSMLNRKAPNFRLKDLDGKPVRLADYKGKTLIIDFWATWCQPCRHSFPAVKMAMEKYKTDPNVKFLFIDTRETAADHESLVKKFLSDNNYPFYVVSDETGDDGKMNKVYKEYVMPGIPTKFFIDKHGIIRYQVVGFDDKLTTEQTAAEIEGKIEKVKALK